jgi:hypothetical protein
MQRPVNYIQQPPKPSRNATDGRRAIKQASNLKAPFRAVAKDRIAGENITDRQIAQYQWASDGPPRATEAKWEIEGLKCSNSVCHCLSTRGPALAVSPLGTSVCHCLSPRGRL